MPTAFHGVEAKLYGGSYDLTPFLKTIKTKGDVDTYDATALADLWRIFRLGRASGELTAEGLHSTLATVEFSAIAAALHGTTAAFMHCPEGNTVAAGFAGVYGSVVSRSIKTELANMIMGVVNVQSKKGVDVGQIVLPAASIAATTVGTVVNTGSASGTSGRTALYVNVTAYTGVAAMYDLKLEDSADGATGWATVAGSVVAAASVVSGYNTRIELTPGTVKQYLRFTATKGASAATVNVMAGVAKRWT